MAKIAWMGFVVVVNKDRDNGDVVAAVDGAHLLVGGHQHALVASTFVVRGEH